MGTFYTDEQIHEAIAALESYSPGIWENMKNAARITDPLNEEQEIALTAIVRVLTIILPNAPFVAQAEDKEEARTRLSLDLGRAVRAAIAAEDRPSSAMDEEYLSAALRYVSLNPVRARLVDRARDWRWSSVRAHLGGRHDGVTTLAPVRERYPDFANFLSEETDAETLARLRGAETIGRPLGTRKFLDMLERKTKRVLKPAKRGPKPRIQQS